MAGPGTSAFTPGSGAGLASLAEVVLALLLVVGVIIALGWLLRRIQQGAGGGNAQLRVIAVLALGPRERVVVVALGETQLLLGVSTSGISFLHRLDEPLPERGAIESEFASRLRRALDRGRLP